MLSRFGLVVTLELELEITPARAQGESRLNEPASARASASLSLIPSTNRPQLGIRHQQDLKSSATATIYYLHLHISLSGKHHPVHQGREDKQEAAPTPAHLWEFKSTDQRDQSSTLKRFGATEVAHPPYIILYR
jgi:hypothetical protein